MAWTVGDQEEFEEGIEGRLQAIQTELVRTRIQLTLVLGGVAVIAFLTPLVVTVALFLAGLTSSSPGA